MSDDLERRREIEEQRERRLEEAERRAQEQERDHERSVKGLLGDDDKRDRRDDADDE